MESPSPDIFTYCPPHAPHAALPSGARRFRRPLGSRSARVLMNHSSLPFSSSSQEKNGKTDRKWENPPNQLARNIAPLPKVRRVSVKGQPHGQAQLTRKHEPSRLINIGHGQLKIGT